MPDDFERHSTSESMRMYFRSIKLGPKFQHLVDIKTSGTGYAKKIFRWLEEGQKPVGRPPGKTYNDEPHLIEMGRLLEIGEVTTRHGAAKIVVQSRQLGGNRRDESAIRRLCDGFKEDEARYRRLGGEKIADEAATK